MKTFQERMDEKLELYAKNFKVDELNDANDKALYMIMLRTEIMVEDLQEKLTDVMQKEDLVDAAQNIRRLSDLLKDNTKTIVSIQNTLMIDKKSRQANETANILDYIATIRKSASSYLDSRLVKVYCPDCKILVARFSPVHGHTSFTISFQCSQCEKMIRMRRDERDRFYDLPPSDREWRKQYRAEVIQPKKKKDKEASAMDEGWTSSEAELILSPTIEIEEEIETVVDRVSEDLDL